MHNQDAILHFSIPFYYWVYELPEYQGPLLLPRQDAREQVGGNKEEKFHFNECVRSWHLVGLIPRIS